MAKTSETERGHIFKKELYNNVLCLNIVALVIYLFRRFPSVNPQKRDPLAI